MTVERLVIVGIGNCVRDYAKRAKELRSTRRVREACEA